MKPKVYIETSIPSFYVEVRSEPDMVARRDWTRDWWDNHRQGYEVTISEAVIAELEDDEYPNKSTASALLEGLPVLGVDETVAEIVEAYIRHKLMPQDPLGDALHLGLAS